MRLGAAPVLAKCRALVLLASQLSQRGEVVRAGELLSEAHALAEHENDSGLLIEIMNTSAGLASDGDADNAREHFAAMSERAPELGDIENFAIATVNLAAMLALVTTRPALERSAAAVDAFRTTGDDASVALNV